MNRSVVVLRDLVHVPSPSRDRDSCRWNLAGFRVHVLGGGARGRGPSPGFQSCSLFGSQHGSRRATRRARPASVCWRQCWALFAVRVHGRSLSSASARNPAAEWTYRSERGWQRLQSSRAPPESRLSACRAHWRWSSHTAVSLIFWTWQLSSGQDAFGCPGTQALSITYTLQVSRSEVAATLARRPRRERHGGHGGWC